MVKFDLLALLRRRKISLVEWLSYNNVNSLEDFNRNGERLAGEQGCFISQEMKDKVFFHFLPQRKNIMVSAPPLEISTEVLAIEEELKQNKKSQNNRKTKKNSSKESTDDIELDSLVQDESIKDEPKELQENEVSKQNI